jgi:phage major head subunit gpT-like protein
LAIVSENWAELLTPGLRKIFFDTFEDYPSRIPELFNVNTSSKAVERDLDTGAFADVPEFEGTIEYQEVYKQYETNYEHVEYATGVQITRKLLDDDQYSVIRRYPQRLAQALARTREKKAANIFNNAFSTASFTGGDDLSLCNSAHITTSSSDTQDNAGTLALTNENLETTRLAMRDFTDDRGNIIVVKPDLILIPPELEETAYEITKTPKGYETANHTINFLMGRYDYLVWDYLDDANNWFLIDRTLMKQYLNWFERIPAEFAKTKDFDTYVAKYSVYNRFSCGFSGWPWIYGHQVA